MSEVAQEIGRKIRLWRQATPPPDSRKKQRGEAGWRPHMTIEELAKATGLTVTTVNKLELGYKAPRIESLLSLASAFGCDPNELLPEAPKGKGKAKGKGKRKSAAKVELLEEVHALASQMSIKQLREFIKSAREYAE
ncbi:MAG: helix-turn-helix transcriptional regulator [Myxococcales bacterium]|nr:helix-turn-helix transcriptional regulator [Myxococcales bacterium]